jgi:putative endopeptidase
MRNLTARWLALGLLFVTVGCRTGSTATDSDTSSPDKVAMATAPFVVDVQKPLPPGLDDTALDARVHPCDDFYQYACGGWLQRTEIPADRPRTSRGFIAIEERNEVLLKELLDSAAQGQSKDTYGKLLGDYWATCIDEPKLDTVLPEVQAELAKVHAVKDAKDLAKLLGRWHADGIAALFDVESIQDLKDSSQYVFNLDQGGIGLPDRDYYLKDEAKVKAVREAYAVHVGKMFELLGQKPEEAKTSSDTVMALETQLARASLDNVQRRDPKVLYNRLDRPGLTAKAPRFIWDNYFQALGFPSAKAINVSSPAFFEEVNRWMEAKQVPAWRTYLTWMFLHQMKSALPKRFQDESFRYQSQALTGAKEDRPRWKKCVAYANEQMGEALGQSYVARAFPPEAKATTLKMVQLVEQGFEKNLATLTWMDEATRAEALVKLKKIANKIGYPEKWRDYSKLKLARKSFLSNMLAASRFESNRTLSRVGKPVDKTEWHMPPQTINAYYDGSQNEISFLAGILQPPFFDPKATAPVNLGATGMVVGHEVTHGFDDEGRQFDGQGNLRDWWTEASGKAFIARTECVKDQYSHYTVDNDVKLNGALTLGENVADLGGIKLAHLAMKDWLAAEPLPVEYRYTASQQFFLGFAQSWCTQVRPEFARARAATDPHSPAEYRVNGPLSNLPAFHEAFGCQAGAKMIRPNRCEVW